MTGSNIVAAIAMARRSACMTGTNIVAAIAMAQRSACMTGANISAAIAMARRSVCMTGAKLSVATVAELPYVDIARTGRIHVVDAKNTTATVQPVSSICFLTMTGVK
jgi:hypothetical protein